MTKSDVMKEFLKKTVIPVVVALFLFSMFSRIFVENGAPDYFLIWLACGVPFGIGKMFTLIPIGFGISGTVGVYCTQPCPRRSDRRRNSDLEAGSCYLVSAPDHIQTCDLRKEEKT